MSEEASKQDRQSIIDKAHRDYLRAKEKMHLTLHSVWWRMLWALRLGKLYSITMCRLNLYRKYPDGRCLYCGKVKREETHDRFLG